MAGTVQNNPPRARPQDSQRRRARENSGDSPSHAGRSPGRSGRMSGGPRRQRSGETDADLVVVGRDAATQSPASPAGSLPSPSRAQAVALGPDARVPRPHQRRARHVYRDTIAQALRAHQYQEAQSSDAESVAAPRRRGRQARSAAATASRNHDIARGMGDTSGNDFFESARDEYMVSLDNDVRANMDDSIRAMRKVLEQVMRRPDTGPGLVPDDVALLMGRGVYATAAMALANALPTLCRQRGSSCGLRLFEECHMTPNPERRQMVLLRVFEACKALCDASDHATLATQMQAWVPTLIQHIDEDTKPASEHLQGVMHAVFYAVREVKGALLTSVMRAASEGLDSGSESDDAASTSLASGMSSAFAVLDID